jgi:hypothetical protein
LSISKETIAAQVFSQFAHCAVDVQSTSSRLTESG